MATVQSSRLSSPLARSLASPRTRSHSGFAGGRFRRRASLLGLFGAAFEALMTWQQRAVERHHMQSLSDHQLKDIGLSRADVEQEAAKPFWRD